MAILGINNSRRAYGNTVIDKSPKYGKNIKKDKEINTFVNHRINNEQKEDKVNQFDDKKLADILEVGSGTPILTQKTIKWEADGTLQLTDEQIDYLKSQYDITNMSEQDYYNLMADLTNMNVISGEDVKNQHAAPIVMGVSATMSVGIAEGECSNFQGNLLENVNLSLQSFTEKLFALNNGNQYFSGQNIQHANNDLLNQKHLYQKLSSIYSLMKRD